MNIIRGRVWKFGDNINTDLISPGRYLAAPVDEIKKHVLEAVNPRFAAEARKGDLVVGGKNFGCGSSRESAPRALKALGLEAVVAESFARIFFRNAVAVGLPVVACPSVSRTFEDGETLELDLQNARVTHVSRNISLQGTPLPPEMLDVLAKGGIPSLLKEMFGGVPPAGHNSFEGKPNPFSPVAISSRPHFVNSPSNILSRCLGESS